MGKPIEIDFDDPIIQAFMATEQGNPEDREVKVLMRSVAHLLREIAEVERECEANQLGGIAYFVRDAHRRRIWMVDAVAFKNWLADFKFKTNKGG